MYPTQELQICMAIHDVRGTYSKYAGITMLSLLEHTGHPVHFHILHDMTLSEDNREKLQKNVAGRNASISFYPVDVSALSYDKAKTARFTIGTMFRLKMLDALPLTISKILYLDADIIVATDVAEIFQEDIGDCLLAGCHERLAPRSILVQRNLLSCQQYVNAGVLLWNLARMRDEGVDLYRESQSFFESYPDAGFPDQDALNLMFAGRIAFLPERFNRCTVDTRREKEEQCACIYHFQGDVPRDNEHFMIDRLFAAYLRRTPWWTEVFVQAHEKAKQERERRRAITIAAIERMKQEQLPKVFFGIGGAIHPYIMKFFSVGEHDFFVDNNPKFWQSEHMGHLVKNPMTLKSFRPGSVSIVVTIYRYREVRDQLVSLGFRENQDFFDGKVLLEEDRMAQWQGERENPWDVVVKDTVQQNSGGYFRPRKYFRCITGRTNLSKYVETRRAKRLLFSSGIGA